MIPLEIMQARERRHAIFRLLVIAVGLGLVYAVIPLQNDTWWLGLVVAALALLAIVPITVRRVAAIESSSQPNVAAAEAIVIVVAMLVFAFSSAYLATDRNGEQFVGLHNKVDAVYFTVTTLATVGYGDIHATGGFARICVTVQMILDLSLIAASVHLIIGAARRRSHAVRT